MELQMKGHQPTYKGPVSDPPKVLPAHKPKKEIIMNNTSDSFREENTKLITDILFSLLFTLNKIESHLDSLENKEELETIAYDDNWLNDLIDEVNAYKGKEE